MSNQSLDIPNIRPNDWKRLDQVIRKIKLRLGRQASPTLTGLTITGLTASTLIGANASKALESVTVGTGLDYTRPNLTLSHLGIESLTDPDGDRILFWDDGETASKWLTVSTGLQISTTNLTTKDSEIVHDDLSGFVANEHIDHTSVTLTAGTGLTGGGDISSNRTFAVDGLLEDLDTLGANSADSEFIVGTGAGALTWESGTTVRTSLGLGTGDSPQFTGIELGHASDTTLVRVSAGNVNIEGKLIYRADGTDVPIADGGTGQSTAQLAINALTSVSGATNEHVLTKDTATGNAIFKAAAAGSNHAILDGSVHTDSVADDVTRGSIIYGNSTPKWDELVLGSTTKFLMSDGTDLAYKDIDDLTADASPVSGTDYVMTYDATAGTHKKVLLSNLPSSGSGYSSRVSVYLSSNQSIASGSFVKIQLDTEVFDGDSEFDNATNYRFTAGATGYYVVSAAATFDSVGSGKICQMSIYKNGATHLIAPLFVLSTTSDHTLFGSKIVYLAQNDYLELHCYQNSGSNKNILGTQHGTFFSCHRLS
jgi:hypothetical protein